MIGVEVHSLTNLRLYPGYAGLHTRKQASGAYVNGTRIVKTNSAPSDEVADATPGTVLGSMTLLPDAAIFYFVEWDIRPKIAIGIQQSRITRMN